ncbi:MAG TPA: hypothetical protein VGJ22_09050 [Anaerolineales bacterium]
MADAPQDGQVFHQTAGVAIVFGLFAAGLALAALVALTGGGMLSLMFVLIFGAGFVVMAARTSRSLTFDGPAMTIAYYGWKKTIRAGAVTQMYIKERLMRGVRLHFVHLKLKDGSDLVLNNYKEGYPALKNAVENWMTKYKPAA